MYNPPLYDLGGERQLITSFKGYQNNLVIPENAFTYEENVTSDYYPLLSPRNKRGYFGVSSKGLSTLFSKEEIGYIENDVVYYGGRKIAELLPNTTNKPRQVISMGSKIIIFPDKCYIDCNNPENKGSLEAEYKSTGTVTLSMCKGDGDLYEGYVISDAEPENPKNADLWLDSSKTPNVLNQYSETIGAFLPIAETYIRISCTNIGVNFSKYDGVTIYGLEEYGISNSHIIRDIGNDFFTISGIMPNKTTVTTTVNIKREVPDMDFICESGNRLWGCNSEKNEIYASKLGSPQNFNSFMGISTDSFAASVGTDGDFTGAVTFRGYILFFKENCVHKIYGHNPPYTITTSYIRGVQKGSSKSLQILNETLYYKSPTGVCAYEGGIPVSISSPLGNEYYRDAIGGVLGNKYYISMKDKNLIRQLFVFDEENGIWHREDKLNVEDFCTNNCNLYFIEKRNDTNILGLVDGENKYGNFTGTLEIYRDEDDFDFTLETGLWGLGLPENKYYKSIVIRAAGEKGAFLEVYFEADSSGKWVLQKKLTFNKTGSKVLPFISPRCDHLRIKLKGRGKIKIYSIARKIEPGSEINV